jgi:hypothetical protein
VKKLEAKEPARQQDQVVVAGGKMREERVFNPPGYEAHLVETIKEDILQRNPNIKWTEVAGLHKAKAILHEAMVLPMLIPDYFKVAFSFFHITRKSHLRSRQCFVLVSRCLWRGRHFAFWHCLMFFRTGHVPIVGLVSFQGSIVFFLVGLVSFLPSKLSVYHPGQFCNLLSHVSAFLASVVCFHFK